MIGLDNDYRNSIENDINIYGVKHNIAKLIEFSSVANNHASLYAYKMSIIILKNQKELSKKVLFLFITIKN